MKEGIDDSNITKRKSTCTQAESQEILEMIDMYAKLSLDSEVEEAGVSQDNYENGDEQYEG